MKFKFILAVLMVLTTTLSANVAHAKATENPILKDELTDQVIITMKKGEDLSDTDVSGLQTLVQEQTSIYAAKVPEGEHLQSFIEEMEALPGVEKVEPDFIVELAYEPNDPYTSLFQYHHENINSYEAWDVTTGSADVQVAVLDNGFDLYHQDLYYSWNTYYGTATSFSTEDHGTHVAGIIGASMNNGYQGTGVAPNVTLVPIDVFEMERQAYSSDIIEGIYLAANLGVDIINMSFGGYNYSSIYNDAIQYAHQQGVLLIAAAGNEATMQTMYPAGYDNVVSVASTDEYNESSYFSNYGYSIDIAAPGSSIWSTTPYNDFIPMSGTSMASPVVAGVAALVKSYKPYLSNTDIANRLFDTATDYGPSGQDIIFGHGLVNAAGALDIIHIPEPLINYVGDQSTEVTGYLPYSVSNATVTVSNDYGVIGTATNYYGWDDFAISIPKQTAGSYLTVFVTDEYGNMSEETSVYVYDETPPSTPVVNTITDKTTEITGTSELNTWVSVWEGNSEIGYVYTDWEGKFNIPISPLPVGTELYIEAGDYAGNISNGVYIVVKDGTAPNKPVVDEITDQSTTVTGKAEAFSTIKIAKGSTILAQGKVSETGLFSIGISKQSANTKLTITATDEDGNVSEGVDVVVKDKTAPLKPTVNALTDQSTTLTGKAEANSTIEVKKNNTILVQGQTGADGTFSTSLSKQPADTQLSVVAIDSSQNRSESTLVTVTDGTPPSKPVVNQVTDQSTFVTGQTEASSKVEVRKDSVVIGQAQATSEGTFSITIPKQVGNTKLTVVAIDAASNSSSPVEVLVVDTLAPAKPTVNEISDVSVSVSGQAEPNAKIEVMKNNTVMATGNATAQGSFTIPIAKQLAGTSLDITAIDAAGNRSEMVTVQVVDKTVPTLTEISPITSSSTTLSGKTEAGATVTLSKGGVEIGKATADQSGAFTLTFAAQTPQSELSLVAKDAAGNVSPTIKVVVAAQKEYADLASSHWAYKQVMYLADASIIGGYPDGTFQPNRQTTRAEAARMLASALNLEVVDTPSIFKDVASSHWANDYIVAAAKVGVFKGNPDGTFNPSGKLTRAEMATLLSTAYDLTAKKPAHFSDVKATHWANQSIAAMYENNLTVGYPDGTYRPSNPTTRAEFSMFLAKALNKEFR